VELIPQWLAGYRSGRALEGLLALLALAFFLVFTYEGWLLTRAANDRTPIFELPKFLWYAIIPLSGAIMIGHSVRDLWRLFRGPAGNQEARE
jgi:TRAP-type C4-dicarboxylate transport system permease small subunit